MKRLLKFSDKKIKLFHGTNSKVLDSILTDGLLPEGFTSNNMFNYNDYGRKGQPKHPECVYLTDDLEIAQKYSYNAVKHNGGFPIVIEVEVDSGSLTWDDDAFYKNYGDFDFGERDSDTGELTKEPDKMLWEQSLEINNQCAHYGAVKPDQFLSFYLNEEWKTGKDFREIYEAYKNIEPNVAQINGDKKHKFVEYEFSITGLISTRVSILKRNIYLYRFESFRKVDKFKKEAIFIKLMQFIKNSIEEFGATVYQTPEFNDFGISTKKSCFNYVFGVFKVKEEVEITRNINNDFILAEKQSEIMQEIIDRNATQDEFDSLLNYNPDFIEDLISYCKEELNYNDKGIMRILTKIQNKYTEGVEELQAEIDYLKIKIKINNLEK